MILEFPGKSDSRICTSKYPFGVPPVAVAPQNLSKADEFHFAAFLKPIQTDFATKSTNITSEVMVQEPGKVRHPKKYIRYIRYQHFDIFWKTLRANASIVDPIIINS